VYGARMRGNQRMTAELTLKDGAIVWDQNGRSRDDWDKLGAEYGPQGDGKWDGTLSGGVRSRK
jgi:hypothetical protein